MSPNAVLAGKRGELRARLGFVLAEFSSHISRFDKRVMLRFTDNVKFV